MIYTHFFIQTHFELQNRIILTYKSLLEKFEKKSTLAMQNIKISWAHIYANMVNTPICVCIIFMKRRNKQTKLLYSLKYLNTNEAFWLQWNREKRAFWISAIHRWLNNGRFNFFHSGLFKYCYFLKLMALPIPKIKIQTWFKSIEPHNKENMEKKCSNI